MSILRVIFKKKVSRSIGGDIVLVVFLSLIGILMILPFVYTISTSLKPANELWLFPAQVFRDKADFKEFQRFVFPDVGFVDPLQPVYFQYGLYNRGGYAAAYSAGVNVRLSAFAL